MDTTKLANLIAQCLRPGQDLEVAVKDALVAAYHEGRLDGAMAAARAIATAGVDQQPENRAASPRQQRMTADLELAKQHHPDIDFDKPVYHGRTPHKIVGYNRNAPKHMFIIEGPQGGRYKCPKSLILEGQR
jgi:hypothetical protein